MLSTVKLLSCMLCSMDTSIMESCRIRNVSDTWQRVYVSCPFQHCRVRAT